MFRKVVTVAVLSSTIVLAACNTVRGVGRDVKSAGEAVENSTR